MDKLPGEIILNITNYLPASCITRLNLVSKRFHELASDNELWRKLCFDESNSPAARRRDPAPPKPIPERPIFELQRAVVNAGVGGVARPHTSTNGTGATGDGRSTLGGSGHANDGLRAKATSLRQENLRGGRGIASWDPTVPGEKIDWYSEYIARHAPLHLHWLQQPEGRLHGSRETLEVRGLGLLNDSTLLAPLDDGSVCFWDIGQDSASSSGRITARSRPGLLSFDNGKPGREWQKSTPSSAKIRMPGTGVVESVSIDRGRNKAYFAVQSGLNEVDLTTLQISAYDRYPQPISVLSEAADPTPLTVGTTQALYIHDPRVGQNSRTPTTNIKQHMRQNSDLYRIHANDPDYSMFSQSSPLAILHREPDTIHAAGRFPSILTYDRRFFPQVASTIYSGARLSCITSVPCASVTTAITTTTSITTSSSSSSSTTTTPTGSALAAAGEYNGKGSLELYPLSPRGHRLAGEATRNRTSASSSKCLSLTAHGTRMLFSDSDGMLKWVERNGSTLVRKWNINTCSSSSSSSADTPEPAVLPSRGGLFNAEVNEGDVARKLLPITAEANGRVGLWTGEKVGVLSFGNTRRVVDGKGNNKQEGVGVEGEEVESSSSHEQRDYYARMMRRALERQADEVRFVRAFGF
ncbi:MAG: hypothetical protein Q9163_001696 [Psora crenata]